MAIPKYIIEAAREYRDTHGGNEALFDAFVAGYEATKRPKKKFVSLTGEQKDAFDECWNAYRQKGNAAKAMVEWQKLSMFDVRNILPHIKAYVESRDRIYQKDFERYLRDKIFLTAVFKGNEVIYDPNNASDNMLVTEPQQQSIWQS